MHNYKLLHLPVTIFVNAMLPWKMDRHVFVLYPIYLLWPVIVTCVYYHIRQRFRTLYLIMFI